MAAAFAFKPDHHITFGQLVLYAAPDQSPVSWTLPFEIRFYLVVGALLLCARRFLDRAFIAWGVVQIAIYGLTVTGVIAQPYFGSTLMVEFSLGLAVGALITRRIVIAPVALAALSLLWIFGSCIAAYAVGMALIDGYRHLLYGLPFAVLLYAVVTLENLGRIRVPKLFRRLGDMSYSIYLWHYPVWEFIFGRTTLGSHKFAFGLRYAFKVVVISLLASAASYWLIEKPSIALGRRLIQRKQPPLGRPQNGDALT